jgi:hypothetical protein
MNWCRIWLVMHYFRAFRILSCIPRNVNLVTLPQWRIKEFFSGKRGGGSTNSVEVRGQRECGVPHSLRMSEPNIFIRLLRMYFPRNREFGLAMSKLRRGWTPQTPPGTPLHSLVVVSGDANTQLSESRSSENPIFYQIMWKKRVRQPGNSFIACLGCRAVAVAVRRTPRADPENNRTNDVCSRACFTVKQVT